MNESTEIFITKKNPIVVISALLFTLAVLILGYVMLGLLPMFLFAFGFLGGFVLWLLIPTKSSFSLIKVPYWLTLAFFILHKLEERYLDFFSGSFKTDWRAYPGAKFNSDPLIVYFCRSVAADSVSGGTRNRIRILPSLDFLYSNGGNGAGTFCFSLSQR